MTDRFHLPFEPDTYYHIYHHAVEGQYLFSNDIEYEEFFKRYKKYVQPIAETCCYCLLSNHYHFLIRIKTEKEIRAYLIQKKWRELGFKEPLANPFDLPGQVKGKAIFEQLLNKPIHVLIGHQIGNLMNAYTRWFNTRKQRKGAIFEGDISRLKADNQAYLMRLVHYIHKT